MELGAARTCWRTEMSSRQDLWLQYKQPEIPQDKVWTDLFVLGKHDHLIIMGCTKVSRNSDILQLMWTSSLRNVCTSEIPAKSWNNGQQTTHWEWKIVWLDYTSQTGLALSPGYPKPSRLVKESLCSKDPAGGKEEKKKPQPAPI